MQNAVVGHVTFQKNGPFVLIAGPCLMESHAQALEMAEALKNLTERLKLPFIFKSSFDKANRTSLTGARGIGLEKAMQAFADVKAKFGVPVTTDVHESYQCAPVGEVVDLLQIPAFLSRQTDLLVAAAQTGRAVNVKKAQFMAPWDVQHAINKVRGSGASNVVVTERGATFGYNTLVVDFRSLPALRDTCDCPVIFDATHSVQQPGGRGGSSGGERRFVRTLARAAMAVGVEGVFMETHPDPDNAPSDGPNMVALRDLEGVLSELIALHALKAIDG